MASSEEERPEHTPCFLRGGRRIARSDPSSGSVYYFFVDQVGSTRAMADKNGSVWFQMDYLPYGQENTPAGVTNTCSTSYLFTGYERDAETGLDYAFARYYNAREARFMSADPPKVAMKYGIGVFCCSR